MGFLNEEGTKPAPESVEAPSQEVTPEITPQEPKKVKSRLVVVENFPNQVVRKATADDGTILHYITIAEALTEMLNN